MTFSFDLQDELNGMTEIFVNEKRVGISWKLEETNFEEEPDFSIKTRFQNDFEFEDIMAWIFPTNFDMTVELDTPTRTRRDDSPGGLSCELYFDLISSWKSKNIYHRVTTNTYVDIAENSGDVRFILSNSLNSGMDENHCNLVFVFYLKLVYDTCSTKLNQK